MDNKIKIGIPRGLHYYKYNILWKEFFKELGCDVIVSPETNFEILENGKKYSESEMCLSLKIYIGHVFYLKDKVDYVLVPRIVCEKINSESCTNFIALYDIVNNIFDINILNYNVDERKRKNEESAFIKMGEKLGFGKNFISSAYHKAKKEEYKQNKINYLVQNKKLERNKTKILLVSHYYNTFDNLIGKEMTKILNDLDCEVIYACIGNPDNDKDLYKKITKSLRWLNNQELLNAVIEYKTQVNGIILLSTFPCGPDSLVNEMVSRNINTKILTILADGPINNEGTITRIESFVDIIKGGKI